MNDSHNAKIPLQLVHIKNRFFNLNIQTRLMILYYIILYQLEKALQLLYCTVIMVRKVSKTNAKILQASSCDSRYCRSWLTTRSIHSKRWWKACEQRSKTTMCLHCAGDGKIFNLIVHCMFSNVKCNSMLPTHDTLSKEDVR